MAEDPEVNKGKTPSASIAKDFLPGFPTLTDFSNEGLKRVAEASRAFQSLPPAGPLWDLQKSYPEFRRAMKNCRTRIEPLIKILLEHEMVSVHGYGSRAVEEKLDFLVEANDDILERVGTALDDAEGLFKRAEMVIVDKSVTPNMLKPPGTWGKKRIGSTASGGDFRDTSAQISKKQPIIPVSNLELRPIKKAVHRIRVTEKPQLKFADTIDNSLAPFIPKLNMKPNSMKPLSILPEYTTNNEEFYGHPYELELNRFEPKEWMMEKSTPISPKPLEGTPLVFIDTPDGLELMISELRGLNQIAVDLEHHSYRTFLGLSCLMQISTREKDYIIDTLALWRDLEAVNEIFTNPNVLKVFHGSTCDLEWLQRDFGIYVVGLFDTYLAMKQLNFSHFSLQHLLAHFCSIEVDKKYQLADWRLRPLPAEMLKYARQDTHFLLFIYDLLKIQLLEQGNQNKNLLRAVYDHSKLACSKRYEKPGRNSQLALRKTRRHLNNRQLYAFTELYNWRDTIAREKDESLSFVLPNHMLLTIADTLPKEMTGILACCEPIPPLVQNNLGDLHRIILKARDLPLHEDKVEWTGPDKRKKQKEWMILLNSIYDVNDSTNEETKDQLRLPHEQKDTAVSACSGIVVRTSSSIPFVRPRGIPATKIIEKSSAYERYELSNNILDILRNPTKKASLNMEDPIVRAVQETLLVDAHETDKPLSAVEQSQKKGNLGRVLPEKDYVAFNPMSSSKRRKNKSTEPETPKDEDLTTLENLEESLNRLQDDKDDEDGLEAAKSHYATNKAKKPGKKTKGKFFEKMKWMKKGKKRRPEDEQETKGNVDTPKAKKPRREIVEDKKAGGRGGHGASRFFTNPFRAKEGKSVTFKK